MSNETDDDNEDNPGGQWKRRRERFCQEYVLDHHGKNAAVRAGYSEKRGASVASTLLKRPDVIARLEELEKDSLSAAKVTRERIMAELANIAFADPGDYVEWSGNKIKLRDSNSLSREQRSAIAEISEVQYGLKIKFHKKEAALETLARAASMLTDNLKVSDPEGRGFPQKMIIEVVDARGEKLNDGVPGPTTETPRPAEVPNDGDGDK